MAKSKKTKADKCGSCGTERVIAGQCQACGVQNVGKLKDKPVDRTSEKNTSE